MEMFVRKNRLVLNPAIVLVLALFCYSAAVPAGTPQSKDPAGSFAGKTVWLVDVNSNSDYTNPLFAQILELLPKRAPGVKLVHVKVQDKGNPFFLLQRENYPEAAIIGVGLCDFTTPKTANYAAAAKEKNIPVIYCYTEQMKALKEKLVVRYRISDVRGFEIPIGMLATDQNAQKEAERLTPMFIEALAAPLK
jgi:hypothetical protein